MDAAKCNITNHALQVAAKLIYGVSCDNASCQVGENYMMYLNCDVDHEVCDAPPCIPVDGVAHCTMDGITLTISNITIMGATVTFAIPEHPYTVSLYQGLTLLESRTSPVSPINYGGLVPNTTYTVVLVQHCPFGEDREIRQDFTTLIACSVPASITITPEEE